MPQKTIAVGAEIIRDTVKSMPRAASRTIARRLHKEHPKLFPSVEAARTRIRYVRGTTGTRLRKYVTPIPRLEPLQMPPSVAERRPFFTVTGDTSVLVLSDIHFPFHDPDALETALRWGKKRNPDIVYLNGDTLEQYGTSRWEPDPRKRDVPQELKLSLQGLQYIRECFPKSRIVFKHGNHEDRWERYMIQNAPVLLGIEEFQLSRLLRFSDLGIEEVESRQVALLGKLMLVHGHELPKGMNNPVNPARGLFLRVNETAMCGHFHQSSQHSDSTGIRKRHISCWSTGCLCDLSPDYAVANKWNHGAAWVQVKGSGEFAVENVQIINGLIF